MKSIYNKTTNKNIILLYRNMVVQDYNNNEKLMLIILW